MNTGDKLTGKQRHLRALRMHFLAAEAAKKVIDDINDPTDGDDPTQSMDEMDSRITQAMNATYDTLPWNETGEALRIVMNAARRVRHEEYKGSTDRSGDPTPELRPLVQFLKVAVECHRKAIHSSNEIVGEVGLPLETRDRAEQAAARAYAAAVKASKKVIDNPDNLAIRTNATRAMMAAAEAEEHAMAADSAQESAENAECEANLEADIAEELANQAEKAAGIE